ncbi:hypothetical protein QJQ45_003793 [Haematococcus lacustris]|nr:hypothetical protein QJQ45_003793 [Haematococcus lacustris]
MGKQEGAIDPLAHLNADWLGCDPGKTNMATVAHEERHPSGAVESVWQRSLSAGQYYRQSGNTQHAKTSKAWMAGIQPEHAVLPQVTNYTASLQRYREYVAMTLVTWPAMWAEMSKPRWSNARFRLYGGKQRTVAKFWAEQPQVAPWLSGSGSIGSKGVPVKQMLREACQQFPGRVLMVHEFRTSRVSSARTNVVAGHAEGFRWLRPVRSMATRSRIRGLMCSTSTGIRFYDRDVSAVLNIRRIAAGSGRPRELSSWLGRPAMPNPGRPGQGEGGYCAIEAEAKAKAVAAEVKAKGQADASDHKAEAQLHQLQADLQHREQQLADNQCLQQLQQQQLTEQQQQLTKQRQQLQQQRADLRRREQDLTERQHQQEQQLIEQRLLTEQQARIQLFQHQLHRLQQQLKAQKVVEVASHSQRGHIMLRRFLVLDNARQEMRSEELEFEYEADG